MADTKDVQRLRERKEAGEPLTPEEEKTLANADEAEADKPAN